MMRTLISRLSYWIVRYREWRERRADRRGDLIPVYERLKQLQGTDELKRRGLIGYANEQGKFVPPKSYGKYNVKLPNYRRNA